MNSLERILKGIGPLPISTNELVRPSFSDSVSKNLELIKLETREEQEEFNTKITSIEKDIQNLIEISLNSSAKVDANKSNIETFSGLKGKVETLRKEISSNYADRKRELDSIIDNKEKNSFANNYKLIHNDLMGKLEHMKKRIDSYSKLTDG